MNADYHCAYCGRAYANRGDRLACCSDRPLPGDAIADGGRGQTVAEALQEIEKECEFNQTCRQTAVTYSEDGVPLCDYHSGEVLTSDD